MTYPIVLAHGVSRFDILWNESLDVDNNDDPKIDRLNYFRGIRTMLKDRGYDVYHSKVAWAANVDKRAADLKENILGILEKSGAEKVNIIAHSMGGLDARHMMFNDRDDGKIHERIASLTTVSTWTGTISSAASLPPAGAVELPAADSRGPGGGGGGGGGGAGPGEGGASPSGAGSMVNALTALQAL